MEVGLRLLRRCAIEIEGNGQYEGKKAKGGKGRGSKPFSLQNALKSRLLAALEVDSKASRY